MSNPAERVGELLQQANELFNQALREVEYNDLDLTGHFEDYLAHQSQAVKRLLGESAETQD